VRVATFVSLGAIVLVIQLAADFFGRFWLDNLSLDGVREEAVEAVLAIAHVEVDAGVEASFDMHFAALRSLLGWGSWTFIDCKILVRTKVFDALKFTF
jgi:hypothetical protein